MKFTLHLSPVNGGPFNCRPAEDIELEADRIRATGSDCSATFPWDNSMGRHIRLWVVGNEYGALGAVWAEHESGAIDELIDSGLGGGLLVEECTPEEEEEMEYSRHGNAGELCDLTHAWIRPVEFNPQRDIRLICAIARADGAGATLLSEA